MTDTDALAAQDSRPGVAGTQPPIVIAGPDRWLAGMQRYRRALAGEAPAPAGSAGTAGLAGTAGSAGT
jgi:hypothetical protein